MVIETNKNLLDDTKWVISGGSFQFEKKPIGCCRRYDKYGQLASCRATFHIGTIFEQRIDLPQDDEENVFYP